MKPVRRISPAGTYFVTTATFNRKSLFQVNRNADLLVKVIREYADQGKFDVESFVIMPDHIHLLITPSSDNSLEICMQLIKGGSSFRLKKELGFVGKVWQRGFTDHRIRDEGDFHSHVNYIHQNPVRRGLCERAEDYPFSSGPLARGINAATIRHG